MRLPHVQREAVLDDEGLGAERAAEGSLARVDVLVGLEVGRLRERLTAVIAAERTLASWPPCWKTSIFVFKI